VPQAPWKQDAFAHVSEIVAVRSTVHAIRFAPVGSQTIVPEVATVHSTAVAWHEPALGPGVLSQLLLPALAQVPFPCQT